MKTTRTEAEWAALKEEHEIAYLRGDVATSSPESYSIEEMHEISDAMEESTAKVDAAIREDFAEKADPGNMEFWNELLGLDMPDMPPAGL